MSVILVLRFKGSEICREPFFCEFGQLRGCESAVPKNKPYHELTADVFFGKKEAQTPCISKQFVDLLAG